MQRQNFLQGHDPFSVALKTLHNFHLRTECRGISKRSWLIFDTSAWRAAICCFFSSWLSFKTAVCEHSALVMEIESPVVLGGDEGGWCWRIGERGEWVGTEVLPGTEGWPSRRREEVRARDVDDCWKGPSCNVVKFFRMTVESDSEGWRPREAELLFIQCVVLGKVGSLVWSVRLKLLTSADMAAVKLCSFYCDAGRRVFERERKYYPHQWKSCGAVELIFLAVRRCARG